MATLLWQDVEEITRDDAKQSLLLLLDDIGFTATSWQPFSTPAIVVELSAEIRASLSRISVLFKNSFMSETSSGESLTQLSRSFWANTREPAVTSQHLITLTCDVGSGPHSINLGELTFEHEDGYTYRNVSGNSIVYPVTLSSGGTVTLLCEAEVAGSQSNVADVFDPTAVTINLQTTLAGVTVTSHQIERSGIDEESDDRLTERNQLKWSTLSRLMLIDEGVQEEALRVAPAVVSVGVDSSNPRGIGTFDVYCAGLDATASVDDVSLVQIALDRLTFGRKNTPKTVQVYASPEVELDVVGTVWFNGAPTAEQVEAAVETALTNFVRAVPVGGFNYLPGFNNIVRLNDIETVIKNAVIALGSTKCTVQLTTPSSDIAVLAFGKLVAGNWETIVYTPIIE